MVSINNRLLVLYFLHLYLLDGAMGRHHMAGHVNNDNLQFSY